jgi:hypothetical protein
LQKLNAEDASLIEAAERIANSQSVAPEAANLFATSSQTAEFAALSATPALTIAQ